MQPQEITVSRTMLISLLGFGALCIAGIVCSVALFWCLKVPELASNVGQILTTMQVLVGALAALCGAGTVSHGMRHWGAAEPGSSFVTALDNLNDVE